LSLTSIQELSYLRAQLHGDAAQVITEFQLTNDNHDASVALLKQRFSEPSKQIEAHMQALVDLPNPSNTLCANFMIALRDISIVLQHWEGLKRLMVSFSPQYYLGNIPLKIKQNMARAHGKRDWTITEL